MKKLLEKELDELEKNVKELMEKYYPGDDMSVVFNIHGWSVYYMDGRDQ